jgi:hypothetical protein
MKKLFGLMLITGWAQFGFSQIPDKIVLQLDRDTLRSYRDCSIIIKLARNDGKPFLFPKDWLIGDDTRNVDLVYNIEKFENNKFVSYRCKEWISIPPFPDGPPVLKRRRRLSIVDSLDDLACITRGKYRLQLF